MPGQDERDPGQVTQDSESEALTDQEHTERENTEQDNEVETHGEPDNGEDKPWCIGCADV